MTASSTSRSSAAPAAASGPGPAPAAAPQPVGSPWILEGFTWLYLVWSLVPIVIAVLFSFNNGRSRASGRAVWRSYFIPPQLGAGTTRSCTPRYSRRCGCPCRPRDRGAAGRRLRHRHQPLAPPAAQLRLRDAAVVVVPELIFGVAMSSSSRCCSPRSTLGTLAEVLALVTWNMSWPAVIVQARLVTLGRHYEEAAADLAPASSRSYAGCCCPLLGPAIFASADAGVLRRHRDSSWSTCCSSPVTPRCR